MIVNFIGTRPVRMTAGAAGYDLEAAEDYSIPEKEVAFVNTGTRLEIPEGYFGMLVPRSSIAKRGLTLNNSVGIIDSDYQGDLLMAYRNISGATQFITAGERIGQVIFVPYAKAFLNKVEEFEEVTERGEGGFGHTGTGKEGTCKVHCFEPSGCVIQD